MVVVPMIYYTIAEVAAIGRTSKMTVYRMYHEGVFPGAIRIRRSIRIPQSDLYNHFPELTLE